MLSAEAARLAAIEVLSPTAAHAGDEPFPTLAGGRIFDSRAAALNEIDDALSYTPVVVVYSRAARADSRGIGADIEDTDASFEIEFIAELATIEKDGEESYVDAVAGDDPEARLVLAALCAQMRRALMLSEPGYLFRSAIRGVSRIEWQPFAVPELGLRFQRTSMILTCMARDDVLTDAPGLPEPIKTLEARLPEGSYAKAKLAQLAEHFAAVVRTPLAGIDFTEADNLAGATIETDP